jgi:hypothetical protein
MGSTLNSFNYLRSARPDWLRRLTDLRVPERLHAALLGVVVATTFTCGACGIEQHRLSQARQHEVYNRQRFQRSLRALEKSRVYYDRVRALVNLDMRVRAIVASGHSSALLLAELANRLPQHAWLTSISRDESGTILEGQARDLDTIGDMLRSINGAGDLGVPTLMSAQVVPVRAGGALIKYVLHLDGAQS